MNIFIIAADQWHQQIALCLQQSSRLNEILDENKTEYKLPAAEADEYEQTTFDMAVLYTAMPVLYTYSETYVYITIYVPH